MYITGVITHLRFVGWTTKNGILADWQKDDDSLVQFLFMSPEGAGLVSTRVSPNSSWTAPPPKKNMETYT